MKTPHGTNYHTMVGRGLEHEVTSADIIASHKKAALIPANAKEYRRMMREYYLMGKELLAYGEILEGKGRMKSDGWARALRVTLNALWTWFDDQGYWNDSFRD